MAYTKTPRNGPKDVIASFAAQHLQRLEASRRGDWVAQIQARNAAGPTVSRRPKGVPICPRCHQSQTQKVPVEISLRLVPDVL